MPKCVHFPPSHQIPLTEYTDQVLEYCEYHQADPLPPLDGEWNSGAFQESNARRQSAITEWDAQYIDCEQEVLFEIIQAASYMDIKALL